MFSESDIKRFWAKVETAKENKCWKWIGAISSGGYPKFSVKRKEVLGHRFSFVLHNGFNPENLCICHSCDNRQCTNPKHLWAGTHKENIQDASKKGRLYKKNCKYGHPLIDQNIWITNRKRGKERVCKLCRKKQSQLNYLRRKKCQP